MSAVRAPSSELALIHGGPGARGSLRDLAEALPLRCLVLEQGRLTIEGLLEEMDAAIEAPMTLLGHSWGAWLATLYAARRPARVRKLILVGSGSFSPDHWRTKKKHSCLKMMR